MGKTKIAYSFIENKDIFFFLLGFNPLTLMLLVKLYKQKRKMMGKISNKKGKMIGKISNMKGKIQIEVKDLITNHSESVSHSILLAALIFPSC